MVACHSLASLPSLASFYQPLLPLRKVPGSFLPSTLLSILVLVPSTVPSRFLPLSLPSYSSPCSSFHPLPPLSLFPSPFPPSWPWCPVLPSVLQHRAGAGFCTRSCWLPSGATSCLQRLYRVRNGSSWSSTLLLFWCDAHLSSPSSPLRFPFSFPFPSPSPSPSPLLPSSLSPLAFPFPSCVR